MAMELLSFDNQFVTGLPPHDEEDNLVTLYIIQGTQVSYPQLKLRQRIGSQPFDSFRRSFGLVLEPGQDRRFQDSPITRRQGPKLSFAVLGDGDPVGHRVRQGTRLMLASSRVTSI
jgi:hypothetical protein